MPTAGAESAKAKRRRIAFVLLSVLLYAAGVASLYFYPTHLARQTYVSENALLVGGAAASPAWSSVNEFLTRNFRLDEPKSLLATDAAALFRSLGLETYTQVIPRNGSTPLRNVYAYIRALKTAGSEAVVLSSSSSNYGFPLVAAFAKVLRDAQWFSKDVALLVADGAAPEDAIDAWLKSYHELPAADVRDGFVRSGVIQAALHLDLRSPDFPDLQAMLLGESGKLPNLDLFNTLARSAAQDRMHVRLPTLRFLNQLADMPQLHTLLSMVCQLASGVPNGAHSSFLRYHIPALTVRSGANTGKPLGAAMQRTGRILEMVVRSVMSLVESFHQSFYFYLLLSEWHYVSIGTYMISLALTLAPLLLTLLYLFYFGQPSGLPHAVLRSIAAHAAAFAAFVAAPHFLGDASLVSEWLPRAEIRMVVWLLLSYQLAWLFSMLPASLPLAPANTNALRIVYILPLSVFLGVASLLNFSFALVAAAVLVPFACLHAALRSRTVNTVLWCLWSIPALAFAASLATGVPLAELVAQSHHHAVRHNALAFPFVTLLLLPMHVLALMAAIGRPVRGSE